MMTLPIQWTVMPSSHHRQRQDKTVLSCRHPRCELNWGQVRFTSQRLDKTVQSPICWGLLKTVCDCHQLSSHSRHRRDSLVLSAVWNRHNSLCHMHLCINLSRGHSLSTWLSLNDIYSNRLGILSLMSVTKENRKLFTHNHELTPLAYTE